MNIDITYQFMIPLLEAFHGLVHSYGWAIILTTLLIRLLVWPLVASSTKSMQRMSQLQPKLKELQERYKDTPEVFQKKTMEFYQKNKINPLGGCLPTLVQLPILIALYATFMGPPFQDKAIPVKVNIAPAAQASTVKVVSNPTSGATSPYLSETGKLAKFAVQPGDQTIISGSEPKVIDFHTIAVSGDAPANFKPEWKIQSDSNGATIVPETGAANFPKAGDIVVEAAFPNGAQPIDVPITVQPSDNTGGGGFLGFGGSSKDPFVTKTGQSANTSVVNWRGQQIEVAVTPGPSTVLAGSKNVPFELKAIKGSIQGLPVQWRIVKDPNAATIDQNGHAVFPQAGEVVVSAMIPGVAKNEPFYFVSSLGKVATRLDMFKPENWDVLSMLGMFLLTMYLSQKLMMPASAAANMDPDQAAIQKQTQQTMPIAITAMFFFYPLPAGVYLYLVSSNIVQTLQTWLIYKQPAATLVDVEDHSSDSDKNGGKIIDVTPGDGDAGGKILDSKKKQKKK